MIIPQGFPPRTRPLVMPQGMYAAALPDHSPIENGQGWDIHIKPHPDPALGGAMWICGFSYSYELEADEQRFWLFQGPLADGEWPLLTTIKLEAIPDEIPAGRVQLRNDGDDLVLIYDMLSTGFGYDGYELARIQATTDPQCGAFIERGIEREGFSAQFWRDRCMLFRYFHKSRSATWAYAGGGRNATQRWEIYTGEQTPDGSYYLTCRNVPGKPLLGGRFRCFHKPTEALRGSAVLTLNSLDEMQLRMTPLSGPVEERQLVRLF